MMSVRTIRICAVAAVVALTAAIGWAGLALADSGSGTTTVQLASSDEAPGDISGPCDEPENAGRARCAGVSVPQHVTSPSTSLPATSTVVTPPTTQPTTSTTSATTAPPAPAAQPAPPAPAPSSAAGSFDAAGAGTVSYTVDGGTLVLVSASPAAGWVVEVEQASGRELELDFRSGDRRVQVNVEFEDGGVRERVRVRDDSDDSRVEITNGQVTEVRGDDGGGSGSGSDDNSGSGHGSDDGPGDDRSGDNSGSGHGSDDGPGDDRSGDNSGSGHGSDDGPRDDSGHGGGDDRNDD
jgi:hypothetical protein